MLVDKGVLISIVRFTDLSFPTALAFLGLFDVSSCNINESNTKLPLSIFKFSYSLSTVFKPSAVALNGGEVSVAVSYTHLTLPTT